MEDERGSYLAVDKFYVLRALRVTVTSSIRGASQIGCRRIAVGCHLREVKRAIESAGKVGNVNIKSKFLVHKHELLILGWAGHEVVARADVGTGDEVKSQRIS